MNHYDEMNAKMQAEQSYQSRNLGPAQTSSYYGDTCTTQGNLAGEYRPSPTEQAEKNAAYHADQAFKAQSAAAFFRQNPAFDEFIRHIRAGVIQL